MLSISIFGHSKAKKKMVPISLIAKKGRKIKGFVNLHKNMHKGQVLNQDTFKIPIFKHDFKIFNRCLCTAQPERNA